MLQLIPTQYRARSALTWSSPTVSRGSEPDSPAEKDSTSWDRSTSTVGAGVGSGDTPGELEGSPPVGLPERLQAHRERARTPDRARAARRFQCFISFSNHELRFVRSCTK